jgi:hypothetical protein
MKVAVILVDAVSVDVASKVNAILVAAAAVANLVAAAAVVILVVAAAAADGIRTEEMHAHSSGGR